MYNFSKSKLKSAHMYVKCFILDKDLRKDQIQIHIKTIQYEGNGTKIRITNIVTKS